MFFVVFYGCFKEFAFRFFIWLGGNFPFASFIAIPLGVLIHDKFLS